MLAETENERKARMDAGRKKAACFDWNAEADKLLKIIERFSESDLRGKQDKA